MVPPWGPLPWACSSFSADFASVFVPPLVLAALLGCEPQPIPAAKAQARATCRARVVLFITVFSLKGVQTTILGIKHHGLPASLRCVPPAPVARPLCR